MAWHRVQVLEVEFDSNAPRLQVSTLYLLLLKYPAAEGEVRRKRTSTLVPVAA